GFQQRMRDNGMAEGSRLRARPTLRGPIMTKLGMLGTIAGAAILTAAPLSLQSHTNVGLSLASAEAQERPLTATRVAGVSRRAYRRAYRSPAYASAAGNGSGSYSGYGCPASSYWVPYG